MTASLTDTIRDVFPQVGDPNSGYLVQLLQSDHSSGFGQRAARIRHLAGASVFEYADISAHRLQFGVLLEHFTDGSVRVASGISLTQDGVFGEEKFRRKRQGCVMSVRALCPKTPHQSAYVTG